MIARHRKTLPLALQMAAEQTLLYGVILFDAVLAGQLGVDPLAAQIVVARLVQMTAVLFQVTAIGGSILVAQSIGRGDEEDAEPLLRAIGMEEGTIDALKRAYAQGGPAGAAPLVTRREIDMLTIVGNVERVRATCARLAARGVGQIGILLTGADAGSNCRVLERIARDVMPHFS